MLIDTHAHLDLPQFDADRAAVVERAQAAGVGVIANAGADMESIRPAEVDLLVSDPRKARERLGWQPAMSFEGLIRMMVNADMAHLRQVYRL